MEKMICYEDFEVNGNVIAVKCKRGVPFGAVYNYVQLITNETPYYKGERRYFKRKKGMIILDLTLIDINKK